MSDLLIGGSGFIGSTLGQTLADAGESVISLSRTKASIRAGIQQVLLNLHTDTIPTSLLHNSPDVYILTGQTGPLFAAATELASLTRILEVLKEHDCHVFFFSTALIYGNCTEPATEATLPRPVGSYPAYKLTAEQLLQDSLPPEQVTILRVGNVYGNPRNRGFINLVIRSLLDKTASPIALSNDGQTVRDYIFLDDLIRALFAIKTSSVRHGIINVVSGVSYTLRDIIAVIEALTGRTVPITNLAAPIVDELLTLHTANTLLRNHFGFSTFSPIELGPRQTLQRYEEELA